MSFHWGGFEGDYQRNELQYEFINMTPYRIPLIRSERIAALDFHSDMWFDKS